MKLILPVALFFASQLGVLAQANDNFNNAIPLVGPIVTTTGNNLTATKQFGQEPTFIDGNFGGASVWWTWTATASGQTTIDTEGSDFNTLLGVFTGTAANALTLVDDNNDYNGNPWSRVQFDAVAGTVYRILVDGLRTGGGFGTVARGNIVLHVQGVGGIEFVSPTNGMVFTFGDPIPVSVEIDETFPNPPATRVDFYRGGVLFGSSTEAPFSAVATNVPAGSNSFYVVTTDSTGMPVQSATVNVLVQTIGVTILFPSEDTVYVNTNPIMVSAWAYLPSGSITNVEFFVDGVKFGEAATQPLNAFWTNVVPGSHRFTAIGRADTGLSYVSPPVNIGVAATLMPFSSVWKYLDDGSDQGSAWFAPDFNDNTWASGPAPLGYSDSNGRAPATTNSFGPSPNSKYPTTYYRRTLVLSNLASFSAITLNIERDDGAIVYLNGVELRRYNMPTGAVNSATFAASNANDDGGTVFSSNLDPAQLIEGTNVFAVEIHQDSGNSSDIWFQMQLVGNPIIIHNLSPEVALTQPTNGFHVLTPASIALEATASDADGSVVKVQFYAGTTKVGESTNAPYSAVWDNPPIGPHALTAVAIDDQGGTTQSAPVAVDVYDALGTPFTQITSPADGYAVEGGTNQIITAYANAPGGIANVEFIANGSLIGNDATRPFAIVWDAPFGTNELITVAIAENGSRGTSAVVRLISFPNTIAPRIATQTPLAGTGLTNFTSMSVVFTEPVHHVDASDLLVSGVPATGVTGSGATYTFTFTHPPYGDVTIAWAAGHGITDFGFPSDLAFDELRPESRWSYPLVDRTLPTVGARFPAPGSTVTNLAQISVNFSELVSGVDAADLLVNGVPALSVTSSGSNYIFNVTQPQPATLNVTWATNHGITDLATTPNAFNRSAPTNIWSFILDTRVVLVQSNSNWRFVKGFADASQPVDAWRQPAFDDSTWSNSVAPFFFGDTGYTNALSPGTFLGDMLSNYTTVYLRGEFTVENRGAITSLLLSHQSDDGFIAWLNGFPVARYNVPAGELPYSAVASTAANEPNQNGAGYLNFTLTNAAVSRLVNGRNVLAIQALNQNLTNSSDFGFNAQLHFFPVDPGAVPPRIVSAEPAPGDIFYLTNVTMNFSEGVTGVDAADLLVNGVPAAGVNSTTNATYTFSFPQPPYGPVAITWATNDDIVDFDNPPRAFDGSDVASRVNYILLNPSSPRIIAQTPPANTTITGLTSVVLSFNEPVTGVEAADFFISDKGATSMTTSDNITFRFDFPQPPFGAVTIRWIPSHGITDVEPQPAPFDHTRFGGQWNYTLIDPVPSVVMTSPTNGTHLLVGTNATLRATATDNDGTIERVEFFEGANSLGEMTNAPYTVVWSNLVEGVFSLRAVATDNTGIRGTSAPVILNVVTNLPIYLIRGPYLQSGSPTAGLVRWRTHIFSDAVVYYGTDPEWLTNTATELVLTNEHIVQLSGLEPDTKYFYSIGSSIQRIAGTNGIGSEYWFRTSPVPGTSKPTRLWVLGDAGTAGNGSPDRQASTRDAFYNFAATNGPADLWLMLGDNAYNVGSDAEHQRAVFDMYPDTLRNLFLWPVLGNHETSQSTTASDFPYLHIFSLPKNGEAGGIASGTEKYYSYDYANIHFVALDSMTSGLTTNTPMAQWLRDDLAATSQEWIIVFFHHPPYTKGSHDSDRENDLVQIRQNLVPILEEYGVDLVLSGHSHCYERSWLMDGHYGMSTTFSESMKVDGGDGNEESDGAYQKNSEGRGVVYTVAGASGQATGGQLNHPAFFTSLNELGSMVIDVNANRLDGMYLHADGSLRDHFTLLKPDHRPARPPSLVAQPNNNTEIALTWTAGSTNHEAFIVERSLDGANFSELVTVSADVTTTLDSGLTPNVTYFYRVRATNSSGFSDYSNIASATTVMPASLPRAPIGLAASAENGGEHYRSQMLVRWQDRSTNEAGFLIERSLDGSSFAAVATVGANLTYFLDHGLDSATAYLYRVRAFNSLGQSAPSNIDGDATHPQSQLATTGDTVVFRAGVEGAPPITWQWRFNGVPIPGATNQNLVLENAQLTDDGTYNVVIRDATGRLVSNPAYLLVVAPPRIVVEPPDTIGVAGASTSLAVAIEGTEPLRFRWHHNDVLIPNVNGPVLSIPNVQFSDAGGYHVIIDNDFGSVTSRVATLGVFSLPTLAAVPDVFTDVLQRVVITNIGADPNSPPLNMMYSLAPGAPTNASINPLTGVFTWTPARHQAPGTNVITVRFSDATRPILSASTSFTIYVNDYVEVSIGSLMLLTGTNGVVPIDFFSSLNLSQLECILPIPGNRLTNLTVQQIAPDRATVSLQMSDTNTAVLTFTAASGVSLQGTQQLARLNFMTTPTQDSAFVPLRFSSVEPTPVAPELDPALLINDGRLVILGAQSLLEARRVGAGRELVLYGRPGALLTIQSRFGTTGAWANRTSFTMTNFVRVVGAPSPTAPIIYYRLRQ